MRPLICRLVLWIGCVGFCGIYGCHREPAVPQRGEDDHGMNRAKFRNALAALVRREHDINARVVFEEAHTRKFVQFLTGEVLGPGLVLDLPGKALDPAEGQRAEAFFHERGVRAKEYDVIDHRGEVVGRSRTFEMKLGQDVEAAATLAEQIFERVYQFHADFALVVQEN